MKAKKIFRITKIITSTKLSNSINDEKDFETENEAIDFIEKYGFDNDWKLETIITINSQENIEKDNKNIKPINLTNDNFLKSQKLSKLDDASFFSKDNVWITEEFLKHKK